MHVAVGRILAGVALLVTSLVSGAAAQAPATSGPAYVTRVMDGDTLCAELGGRLETVRYLGINTPWIEHPVYGPAAYASLSREANRRLVEGKWVRLVFDGPARDHFGRLIAYVWVGNVFVNAALVHKGYGEAATDSSSRYADYFQMLQDGARRHARGLWRDPSALAHHRPSATELAADTRDASSRALDAGRDERSGVQALARCTGQPGTGAQLALVRRAARRRAHDALTTGAGSARAQAGYARPASYRLSR
jgi:micrococcal nuclease